MLCKAFRVNKILSVEMFVEVCHFGVVGGVGAFPRDHDGVAASSELRSSLILRLEP